MVGQPGLAPTSHLPPLPAQAGVRLRVLKSRLPWPPRPTDYPSCRCWFGPTGFGGRGGHPGARASAQRSLPAPAACFRASTRSAATRNTGLPASRSGYLGAGAGWAPPARGSGPAGPAGCAIPLRRLADPRRRSAGSQARFHAAPFALRRRSRGCSGARAIAPRLRSLAGVVPAKRRRRRRARRPPRGRYREPGKERHRVARRARQQFARRPGTVVLSGGGHNRRRPPDASATSSRDAGNDATRWGGAAGRGSRHQR